MRDLVGVLGSWIRTTGLVFVVSGGIASSVFSQSEAPVTSGGGGAQVVTPEIPQIPTNALQPGAALESAIEGWEYKLGPGDRLTVSIWGPQSFTYELPVTLEGNLLLPTMGVVPVNQLTLDEAKVKIRDRILEDFRNVEVTVTLTQLRRFQVHVLGQVVTPGTYLASAVDRVSSAVGWAGGMEDDASFRGIEVRNQGEVRARADLFSFWKRGEPDENPVLEDGDVVYVPFRSSRFAVQGAVHEPGDYEFVKGDQLSDAIFFAGGMTSDAEPETLEVARFPKFDAPRFRFFVTPEGITSADDAGAGSIPEDQGRFRPFGSNGHHSDLEFPNFALEPGDMIIVRSSPIQNRDIVEILGEIEHPGFYPIIEGETRLSDVIKWAGGMTARAFPQESQLLRRESIRLEDREFERLSRIPVADMTPDEYEYFKVRSRENPGLMVVDFEGVIAGTESEDHLLRSGDLITVATRRDFISVIGMVSDPGNIPFETGVSVNEYIARAGGYAEKADKGKTRVIRAGTGEWVPAKEVVYLRAGDAIWTPEKRERDYWILFKDTLTVTAQILAIYLIVDQAINR